MMTKIPKRHSSYPSIKKMAEVYFDSDFLNQAAGSSVGEFDFTEFLMIIDQHIQKLLNRPEVLHHEYKVRTYNRQELISNPNNFSVKINNRGLKKELYSYAKSSTEILQIIKRYTKPGDKVRLLSGTRFYEYKVLANGKFKKL